MRSHKSTLYAGGALAFGLSLFLASALGARPLTVGLMKDEPETIRRSLRNSCDKRVTLRFKVSGVEIAKVPRKLKLPPSGVVTLQIRLDASKARKRRYDGTVNFWCKDCARKGCPQISSGIPINVSVLDPAPLQNAAHRFAARANLPVRLTRLSVHSHVSTENLQESAELLLRHTVFLEDGSVRHDEDDTAEALAALAEEMIARELVRSDQFLIEAAWEKEDGTTFTTLAASDEDGQVTYEPVLYFTAVEERSRPEPRRGSWTWGPWTLTLSNFFGICVDVRWGIAMHHTGCLVEAPGPHFESMSSRPSECFGWKQATLYGEVPWCRGNAECRAGCSAGEGRGESCVKWGVVTHVTHGLSYLEVDDRRPGSLDGIPLPATVTVHRRPFGKEAVYKTVCSLCALSGGLPPCSSAEE